MKKVSNGLALSPESYDALSFRERQVHLQRLFDRRMNAKIDFDKVWSDLQ